MTKRTFYFFAAAAIVFLAGCRGNEKKLSLKKTSRVYCDFKIRGEEGSRYFTCLFQFKPGGVHAVPVSLMAPAFVSLNGQMLTPDSSRYAGVFYEAALIADTTSTDNKIIFNDGRKSHEELFSLQPFSMAEELPAVMSRKNFAFQLQPGFSINDSIRILLTDTAFLNDDVNELVAVKNGVVVISAEVLTNLKNGPVHLELVHEKTLPLKNGLNGRLFKSYSLKREFVLVD